jgi:hypothetical protein
MSTLMTLGYAIERAVYAVAGWPQALTQSHLYDTASNYPLIFLEFLLLFTVWTAAGAFAGAAIYRNGPANGLFAIPSGRHDRPGRGRPQPAGLLRGGHRVRRLARPRAPTGVVREAASIVLRDDHARAVPAVATMPATWWRVR